MDSKLKFPSWSTINSSTWADNIQYLIEKKHENIIHGLYINTPYVIIQRTAQKQLFFYNITEGNMPSYFVRDRCFFLKFFMRESYKKRNIGLEITFPAKVILTTINKRNNYFYKWSKNYATISLYLGTTNIDVIKKLADDLFKESKQFLWLYCDYGNFTIS